MNLSILTFLKVHLNDEGVSLIVVESVRPERKST